MTAEVSLISEAMRQAPAVGAVLAVGYFIFKAYKSLVGRVLDVIEASTKAITANTEVMKSLATLIDALPNKVVHELRGADNARLLQEELARRRAVT